jgi:hypothetical protein
VPRVSDTSPQPRLIYASLFSRSLSVWLSSAHKDVKRPSSLRPTLKSENTAVDSLYETPGVEKLGYFDGTDLEKGEPAALDWYKLRPMRLYAPLLTGTGASGLAAALFKTHR